MKAAVRRYSLSTVAEILALGFLYYVTGKFCLSMAIPPGIATPVWIPSGISLAALLMRGKRLWPGIVLGSFLLNSQILESASPQLLFTSFLVTSSIGLGSALQAMLGVSLIHYLVGRRRSPFDCVSDVFKFTGIETLVCLIAPTVGVASLFLGHYIFFSRVYFSWWTWWTGDFVGVLTVTPLLIIHAKPLQRSWNWIQSGEFLAYFLYFFAATYALFGGDAGSGFRSYLMPYMLIPFPVWAAFRFGQRAVTLSVLLVSGMAVWGTLHGYGPFVRRFESESLLALQPFVAILAVTGLALSAALEEHRRAQEALLRSQRNLLDFIENATLGLQWVGPDGKILWANKAELKLLGYAPEEYIGHRLSEFHADPVVEDIFSRLKNHEELQDYEARLRCKDGSIKYVLLSTNVLWENGKFIHTRCFTRDITDRKRAEENLLKAHGDLELRVEERTQELLSTYKALEVEMEERLKTQKEILEISEREQKRIGQDLHDGLAQQLAGLSFMSKSLQYKLTKQSLPEASEMGDIVDLLKKAIDDTRRLSRGFYPVELEKLGLFPALKELAFDTEKMFRIPCLYQFDESIQIKDDAIASHVYRMSQEAVSNAVKHAKPSYVSLSIQRSNGCVVLAIEDDGIGIEEKQMKSRMGLRIMNYRAKMIGASFRIEKKEKKGTLVTFKFRH